MLEWFKRTRRYYTVVNELSRLSDRELADIGITRLDIHYLATEMIYRPKI